MYTTSMISGVAQRYRAFWSIPYARRASGISMLAFLCSLAVQYYSIVFATEHVSNSATDIILSNIPVYDIDGIYVYGLFCLVAFIVLLCLAHPKRIPFTLYSLALFIVIRSAFVTLTHLAPYPIPPSPDFGTTMQKIFFGGDLFFSGHTGAPFLMALIYWREELLRYTFIILSVFFATVVLLAHLHYSIDVFAAYFITYTIYHLALYFFPKSQALLIADDPVEAKPV